jgi:glycosyltransferase involved in cell wall biosynthesis
MVPHRFVPLMPFARPDTASLPFRVSCRVPKYRAFLIMPSVDIVIPCYNQGGFLPDSVGSVLGQQVDDLRILIVDNASTDGSAEVARQLASGDSRIELLLRSTNQGPHASFNAGVDWARSDYFLILCADDILAPGCLARAVNALQRHKEASFAFGGQLIWEADAPCPAMASASHDASCSVVGAEEFVGIFSLPHRPVGTGSILVRTTAQKQAGHYRPELYYTDDLEMLMRLAALGGAVRIDAIQGVRRRHGANISAANWGSWQRELREVWAAYASFFAHEGSALPWGPPLERKIRTNVANRAYWSAVSHRMRGLKAESVELMAFSRSLDPAATIIPPFAYWLRVENVGAFVTRRLHEIFAQRKPAHARGPKDGSVPQKA